MTDFALILVSLSIVGVPLAIQAHCVLKEKHGYRKDPKYKDHPELKGVRKGDRMLVVNFNLRECSHREGKSQ